MMKKIVPLTSTRNLLVLVVCLSASGLGRAAEKPGTLRVTHVLGFENSPNNQNGQLSIQDGVLRFQNSQASAQININSVQDVYFGQQDKQVGGTPMALGRTAAPFGGGRVVSLFAHKKYGIVTVVYRDANGGLHGAIFQLDNADVQDLREELEGAGARVSSLEVQSASPVRKENKNETK